MMSSNFNFKVCEGFSLFGRITPEEENEERHNRSPSPSAPPRSPSPSLSVASFSSLAYSGAMVTDSRLLLQREGRCHSYGGEGISSEVGNSAIPIVKSGCKTSSTAIGINRVKRAHSDIFISCLPFSKWDGASLSSTEVHNDSLRRKKNRRNPRRASKFTRSTTPPSPCRSHDRYPSVLAKECKEKRKKSISTLLATIPSPLTPSLYEATTNTSSFTTTAGVSPSHVFPRRWIVMSSSTRKDHEDAGMNRIPPPPPTPSPSHAEAKGKNREKRISQACAVTSTSLIPDTCPETKKDFDKELPTHRNGCPLPVSPSSVPYTAEMSRNDEEKDSDENAGRTPMGTAKNDHEPPSSSSFLSAAQRDAPTPPAVCTCGTKLSTSVKMLEKRTSEAKGEPSCKGVHHAEKTLSLGEDEKRMSLHSIPNKEGWMKDEDSIHPTVGLLSPSEKDIQQPKTHSFHKSCISSVTMKSPRDANPSTHSSASLSLFPLSLWMDRRNEEDTEVSLEKQQEKEREPESEEIPQKQREEQVLRNPTLSHGKRQTSFPGIEAYQDDDRTFSRDEPLLCPPVSLITRPTSSSPPFAYRWTMAFHSRENGVEGKDTEERGGHSTLPLPLRDSVPSLAVPSLPAVGVLLAGGATTTGVSGEEHTEDCGVRMRDTNTGGMTKNHPSSTDTLIPQDKKERSSTLVEPLPVPPYSKPVGKDAEETKGTTRRANKFILDPEEATEVVEESEGREQGEGSEGGRSTEVASSALSLPPSLPSSYSLLVTLPWGVEAVSRNASMSIPTSPSFPSKEDSTSSLAVAKSWSLPLDATLEKASGRWDSERVEREWSGNGKEPERVPSSSLRAPSPLASAESCGISFSPVVSPSPMYSSSIPSLRAVQPLAAHKKRRVSQPASPCTSPPLPLALSPSFVLPLPPPGSATTSSPRDTSMQLDVPPASTPFPTSLHSSMESSSFYPPAISSSCTSSCSSPVVTTAGHELSPDGMLLAYQATQKDIWIAYQHTIVEAASHLSLTWEKEVPDLHMRAATAPPLPLPSSSSTLHSLSTSSPPPALSVCPTSTFMPPPLSTGGCSATPPGRVARTWLIAAATPEDPISTTHTCGATVERGVPPPPPPSPLSVLPCHGPRCPTREEEDRLKGRPSCPSWWPLQIMFRWFLHEDDEDRKKYEKSRKARRSSSRSPSPRPPSGAVLRTSTSNVSCASLSPLLLITPSEKHNASALPRGSTGPPTFALSPLASLLRTHAEVFLRAHQQAILDTSGMFLYTTIVAMPNTVLLERHARLLLCARRDLFMREAIDLFMDIAPGYPPVRSHQRGEEVGKGGGGFRLEQWRRHVVTKWQHSSLLQRVGGGWTTRLERKTIKEKGQVEGAKKTPGMVVPTTAREIVHSRNLHVHHVSEAPIKDEKGGKEGPEGLPGDVHIQPASNVAPCPPRAAPPVLSNRTLYHSSRPCHTNSRLPASPCNERGPSPSCPTVGSAARPIKSIPFPKSCSSSPPAIPPLLASPRSGQISSVPLAPGVPVSTERPSPVERGTHPLARPATPLEPTRFSKTLSSPSSSLAMPLPLPKQRPSPSPAPGKTEKNTLMTHVEKKRAAVGEVDGPKRRTLSPPKGQVSHLSHTSITADVQNTSRPLSSCMTTTAPLQQCSSPASITMPKLVVPPPTSMVPSISSATSSSASFTTTATNKACTSLAASTHTVAVSSSVSIETPSSSHSTIPVPPLPCVGAAPASNLLVHALESQVQLGLGKPTKKENDLSLPGLTISSAGEENPGTPGITFSTYAKANVCQK